MRQESFIETSVACYANGLAASEFEIKPSAVMRRRREERREGKREQEDAAGCCARTKWGEEPRDRDLFISRREAPRVRSYILLASFLLFFLRAPPARNLFLHVSLSFSTRLLAADILHRVIARSYKRNIGQNERVSPPYKVYLFSFLSQ